MIISHYQIIIKLKSNSNKLYELDLIYLLFFN